MLVYLTLLSLVVCLLSQKYTPDWDSIDSRPLPDWYDRSKFGIFCHWGVYSVPAYRQLPGFRETGFDFLSEWFWWYWKGSQPDPNLVSYVDKNYKPGTTYADFAKDFTAEWFNPDEFADIVSAAGARYFVFTSKHHEGFTMWPSKTSWNWNSVDVGPKRDIVGDLKEAFNKTQVHFGLYFSLFEWFHPLFLKDGKENTTYYTKTVSYPQMMELITQYEPEVLWGDGEWDKPAEYWKSKEFIAWLYNSSPVKDKIVINDRWGSGTIGKHGGFLTFSDHYDPGTLQPHKWENCLTLDRASWGNRRNMKAADVLTVHEILLQIARTVACNGNVLLNVGPDNHGRIPPIFEDRLRELGSFLKVHEEALYETKPWIYQNDSLTPDVWFTSRYRNLPQKNLYNEQLEKETIVYAWILNNSQKVYELDHVKVTPKTKVTVLGTNFVLPITQSGHLNFKNEEIPWLQLPRRDVFVLKIEYAASYKRVIKLPNNNYT